MFDDPHAFDEIERAIEVAIVMLGPCVLLTAYLVVRIMRWAKRTHRPRRWLLLILALSGSFAGEFSVVNSVLMINGDRNPEQPIAILISGAPSTLPSSALSGAPPAPQRSLRSL